MYAIIEESGGQRHVRQGDEILVDLMSSGEAAVGSKVTFDKVLVVGQFGGEAKIGQPYVAGAKVEGEVIEPIVKGLKLHIFKHKPKKTWKKKTGHRQKYTKVRVTGIVG